MKSQSVQLPLAQRIVEKECLDYDCEREACMATTGPMVRNRRQQIGYCLTNDYDNCPIYLGKALRSSFSQGLARESLVDSGK